MRRGMEREPDIEGYHVIDRHGQRVGRIEQVWERTEDHRPAFAAVKSGRFFGRTHIVPLMDARADDVAREVQVPFTQEVIDDAPRFSGDALSPDDAQEVWRHYMKARDGEQFEMPLFGERVDVRKKVVEQGGVRVRKELRREVVYEPVEVMREHVVVERLSPEELEAAERHAQDRPDEFVLREHGEEPLFETHRELMGGVRATRHVEQEERDLRVDRRVEDVETSRRPPGDERIR